MYRADAQSNSNANMSSSSSEAADIYMHVQQPSEYKQDVGILGAIAQVSKPA